MNNTQTLVQESIDSIIPKFWAGTLLSFIYPNLEITYGSEPFRTVWDWSKSRTKPLEPMYIGSVQFGYFCGLVPVWNGSEPNRGNTICKAL